MPTIAPIRSPTPQDPNAQPISAPTSIAKPVVPSSRPDAVARVCGDEEEVAAAIRTGAYHRPCNSPFPLSERKRARLVSSSGVGLQSDTLGQRPRATKVSD
jgi:hypothetical protein